MAAWDNVIKGINSGEQTASRRDVALPGVDPLDRLPAEARETLLRLRDERDDLRAAVNAVADQREHLRREQQEAEAHVRRLRDPLARGGYSKKPDDPQVIASQGRVDRLFLERARVQSNYDARAGRWQTLARLVTNAEKWLASVPVGIAIVMHPADPKPRKGETVEAAIERLRQQRDELLAELRKLKSAPLPSAGAKARARTEIEALAQRGRPDVFRLIEHGEGIAWPSALATVTAYVAPGQEPTPMTARSTDALALLAWLAKDELLEAIEAEIDQRADDANALTPAQRKKREAELADAILAVERDEAALVEQGGGEHRPDLDPRALLGVLVEAGR
jgi:hypothetical protein